MKNAIIFVLLLFGCSLPATHTVRLVRLPRPTRPILHKVLQARATVGSGLWGQIQLAEDSGPRGRDALILRGALNGRHVIVLDALQYEDQQVALLTYLRHLEESPVWEDPSQ